MQLCAWNSHGHEEVLPWSFDKFHYTQNENDREWHYLFTIKTKLIHRLKVLEADFIFSEKTHTYIHSHTHTLATHTYILLVSKQSLTSSYPMLKREAIAKQVPWFPSNHEMTNNCKLYSYHELLRKLRLLRRWRPTNSCWPRHHSTTSSANNT